MSILNIRFFAGLIFLSLFMTTPILAEPKAPNSAVSAAPVLVDLTKMIRIGNMTTQGVKANAYITRVEPNINRDVTHRIVVTFTNIKTGVAVKKALVGIKHRRLFGDVAEPVWMTSPTGQPELFISNLNLERQGTYLLIVGSKFEDDKKRQFTFQYEYK